MKQLYFLFFSLVCAANALGQDSLSNKLQEKYLNQVSDKATHLSKAIDRQTKQRLNWLIAQETALKAQVLKKDAGLAQAAFNPALDSLKKMKAALLAKTSKYKASVEQYSELLDTLKISAKWLKSLPAAAKLEGLTGSMEQAQFVENFMKQRGDDLKQQLSSYTDLSKAIGGYGVQAFYYRDIVQGYTDLLKDRRKAEEKGLELLRNNPLFKKYFDKYSATAGLFNLGENFNSNRTVVGLQLRDQVSSWLGQTYGNSSAASQLLSERMEQGKELIKQISDKYPNLGNVGDMPNYTPKPMKSKTFLQRLEFGYNNQFQKNSTYFPATADVGGQVGYKFSTALVAGLGASVKLGLGTGWNHIVLSGSGLSIRSYLDYKLKNSYFANGGFEFNYVSAFSHIGQIQSWRGWQRSALMGVGRKYAIRGKMKGTIIVLYDFLAAQQVPYAPRFKFRFGRTF